MLAAVRWAYSWGPFLSKNIIIVGCPDSEKVRALRSIDPELNIQYVSHAADLVENSHVNFDFSCLAFQEADEVLEHPILQQVIDIKPMVLTDRESWNGNSTFYGVLFSHLTGRSSASFQLHLFELGIDIKAIPDLKRLLSIKDVLEVSRKSGTNLRPSLSIAGEIVK